MFSDDLEEELPAGASEDPVVEEAKETLRVLFRVNSERILYQQQLAVLLEDVYFHWVTRRAVEELVAEGRRHPVDQDLFQMNEHIKDQGGLDATIQGIDNTRLVLRDHFTICATSG